MTSRPSRIFLAVAVCAVALAPVSHAGAQLTTSGTLAAPTVTSSVAEVNAYFDQMAQNIENLYNKLIQSALASAASDRASLVVLQAFPPRIPALQNRIAANDIALAALPRPKIFNPDPKVEAMRKQLTATIDAQTLELAALQGQLPRVLTQIKETELRIAQNPNEIAKLQAAKLVDLQALAESRRKALLMVQKAAATDGAARTRTAVPLKPPPR